MISKLPYNYTHFPNKKQPAPREAGCFAYLKFNYYFEKVCATVMSLTK